MYRKIAVCGNIGVGKSTLCKKLVSTMRTGEHTNVYSSEDEANFHFFKKYSFDFLEEWSKNGDVYNRFAYPMIMKFFESRLNTELACTDQYKTYIVDRSLFEDRFIFAQHYMASNLLSLKEVSQYCSCFDKLIVNVAKPDVLVYLEGSVDTLVERIKVSDMNKYMILNEDTESRDQKEGNFNKFLYKPMVDRDG